MNELLMYVSYVLGGGRGVVGPHRLPDRVDRDGSIE